MDAKIRVPRVHRNWLGRMSTHGKHRPRRIVIHSTESYDREGPSDVDGVFGFWQRQGRGLGAHLVIDAEGITGRGAYATQMTWAVAGANTGSIHIELIGFAKFSRLDWMRLSRRRQLNVAAKWCAWYCHRFGIRPARSTVSGICRHADFPGTHWDPGPGFPMRWFLWRVRRYLKYGNT